MFANHCLYMTLFANPVEITSSSVVTVMRTMTEQKAEIDEKCMFAVHAKQLSQYLRQMYGHLVNANILKPFYHDYWCLTAGMTAHPHIQRIQNKYGSTDIVEATIVKNMQKLTNSYIFEQNYNALQFS